MKHSPSKVHVLALTGPTGQSIILKHRAANITVRIIIWSSSLKCYCYCSVFQPYCSISEHLWGREGKQPYIILAAGQTQHRTDTVYIIADKQLSPYQATGCTTGCFWGTVQKPLHVQPFLWWVPSLAWHFRAHYYTLNKYVVHRFFDFLKSNTYVEGLWFYCFCLQQRHL